MSTRCQTCGAREQAHRCSYCGARLGPEPAPAPKAERISERLARTLAQMPGVEAISLPLEEYAALAAEVDERGVSRSSWRLGLSLHVPHGVVEVRPGPEMAVLRRSGSGRAA